MNNLNVYDQHSIKRLSDITHIRLRTSAYIPDTGISGLFTMCREIIDNAADELEFVGTGNVDVFMFINNEKDSWQLVVSDSGRGIPYQKLLASFTEARTSGKFDTKSYMFSSGTFGVGSTVVVSLSEYFRAITMNPGTIADAVIPYDNIPDDVTKIPNTLNRTGTIVLFEPDRTIFDGVTDFVADHFRLVEFLIHLSLFGKYSIRFFEVKGGLTKKMRKAPASDIIMMLDDLKENTYPVYDSRKLDRENYVKSYFGVIKNWTQSYPISGSSDLGSLQVKGEIFVLITNSTSNHNDKLTFVNNILFTDNTSLHVSMLYRLIKDRMAHCITDKMVKVFFIDHYKLPIWLLLDVKYAGAQFSGFAKVSFKDVSFRQPYHQLLTTILTPEMIDSLYALMAENIQISFDKFSNKDFAISGSMRNLMSKLNRPLKFNNCSTTDRESAELFLVEGDSAKSDQDRDSKFQAIYTLGGKPFNGLTDLAHLPESINNIKNNAIFQDIIRILNITPGSNDLKGLNFWKTFIMADADTHGYHITSIVIGNLWAICPALINEGHIYVTMPPLYSLNIKGNEPIYIRNNAELNATLAYHVYYRCLEISIKSDTYSKVLEREEFVVFCELISKIGDELDRLSTEFMIPALLLEQLSLLTNHLNLSHPNVDELRRWLGCEVKYVRHGNLLIISIGSEDIIVPLNQITELIYARILPMYREFYYGRTRIFATTKNSPALKESPITIIQLNEMFKKLSGMFTIKRFKGLGAMPPKDRSRNCTAPSTRRVYQISNIGDVKAIYDMLGDDSTARKRLMTV